MHGISRSLCLAGRPRPFRTPLFPLTPILGAVMCLFLLMSLMAVADTRNFFLIYLGAGIVVYFAFGMRNSKLGKGEPTASAVLAPMAREMEAASAR